MGYQSTFRHKCSPALFISSRNLVPKIRGFPSTSSSLTGMKVLSLINPSISWVLVSANSFSSLDPFRTDTFTIFLPSSGGVSG